jgi:hypothetical protein
MTTYNHTGQVVTDPAYGGQIIEESDIGFALFIRDPDGQLLELLPTSFRASLPPKP